MIMTNINIMNIIVKTLGVATISGVFKQKTTEETFKLGFDM